MVILLLLPVGCVQLDPAGVMRADITGIDAALSRQAVVSRHPHHTGRAATLCGLERSISPRANSQRPAERASGAIW